MSSEEKLLALILSRYEAAETTLLAIVARYATDDLLDEPDNQVWAISKLKNITALKKETIAVLQKLKNLDEEAKKLLLEMYLVSSGVAGDGLIQTNEQAFTALARSYIDQLQASRFQILRSVPDEYRRIIGAVAQNSVLGLDSRIVTARSALAQFAGKGITAFYTKDNKRINITSYIEMASRTAANNAFREGKAAVLNSQGKDLIVISSVPNPSDLCKPYERKILSLSGSSTDYPSLASAKSKGLFHPACRHSFTAYVPGLTMLGATDAEQGFDNYEDTQEQRYAERKTREWKRRQEVAKASGDDKALAKSKAKIKYWRDEAKSIAESNNLVEKPNRYSLVQAR